MEQAPELKELLLRFYAGFSSGDGTLFERLLSDHSGVVAIGTDPAEWWDGAGLLRVSKAQLAEISAANIALVAGDPQCYREGSVGWTADRPTMRLANGITIQMRLTTVFHQEAGEWKLVQMHSSFGVPNVDAIGTELTNE